MTPAEVRILFGVWDAIARAHYNPVNPNDRKISAAPVHSPGYQAWLDARNARWEHKAQLDWAFDPKNEHDPRAGKIRADHYVARGYVVGWVGYKAPRSDIQLIFKAFGYVPVVGIPALLADATVHAYHGEHEEAVLSGFAAISEIAVLAWAARVKPVQQNWRTAGAPRSRAPISHIEFGGYHTLTAGPGTKLRFTVNGEKMWVDMWEATNMALKRQGVGGRSLFGEALRKFPDIKEIRGIAELDNLKAFRATNDINKTPFALSLKKLGFTRFEVLQVGGDIVFIAGR
jgi:hypothetical protein